MTIKLRTLRWVILALLFGSTVLNYLDRQALTVLLPVLREELALSTTDYGRIVTVFMLAYSVSQFGFGLVMDRFGARLGLAWAVGLWSVAAGAHAFAVGLGSLAVVRLALGLGEGGNWPGGGKAIGQWFPRERRAFAMGVFDSGSAVGAILAPPVVSLIAWHYGWRAAFALLGAAGLLWIAAWLVCYDDPRRHRWLSSADRAEAAGEPPAPGALGRDAVARGLWGDARLWMLLLARAVVSPVWWFYVFWLPDYFSRGHGLALLEIGLFGWIPFLAVDLGKLAGGAASDHLIAAGRPTVSARKAIMVIGALTMAGGAGAGVTESFTWALAWVCVATFGFGIWSANILALHVDVFPAGRLGTALGVTGAAASLAGAGAAFAVGHLLDGHGYDRLFFAAGAAPLLAVTVLGFALRQKGGQDLT